MQCTKEKKQRRISEQTEEQETTQWAYYPNQVSQSDQWLLPLTEFKLLSVTTSIDTQHSRSYLFLETKSIMIALRHSTPPPGHLKLKIPRKQRATLHRDKISSLFQNIAVSVECGNTFVADCMHPALVRFLSLRPITLIITSFKNSQLVCDSLSTVNSLVNHSVIV